MTFEAHAERRAIPGALHFTLSGDGVPAMPADTEAMSFTPINSIRTVSAYALARSARIQEIAENGGDASAYALATREIAREAAHAALVQPEPTAKAIRNSCEAPTMWGEDES